MCGPQRPEAVRVEVAHKTPARGLGPLSFQWLAKFCGIDGALERPHIGANSKLIEVVDYVGRARLAKSQQDPGTGQGDRDFNPVLRLVGSVEQRGDRLIVLALFAQEVAPILKRRV